MTLDDETSQLDNSSTRIQLPEKGAEGGNPYAEKPRPGRNYSSPARHCAAISWGISSGALDTLAGGTSDIDSTSSSAGIYDKEFTIETCLALGDELINSYSAIILAAKGKKFSDQDRLQIDRMRAQLLPAIIKKSSRMRSPFLVPIPAQQGFKAAIMECGLHSGTADKSYPGVIEHLKNIKLLYAQQGFTLMSADSELLALISAIGDGEFMERMRPSAYTVLNTAALDSLNPTLEVAYGDQYSLVKNDKFSPAAFTEKTSSEFNDFVLRPIIPVMGYDN